jgi:hypothetical protein
LGLEAYRLMVRLLEEQCEVEEEEPPKFILKNLKDIPGNALQNPSDPDATHLQAQGQRVQGVARRDLLQGEPVPSGHGCLG